MAYRFLLGGLLALGAFLASATASPLDGAKRVAAQFEAAEEGEIPDNSFEDMERNLAKAETELAAYLRTHPDDVDALVLSARLGRIPGATRYHPLGAVNDVVGIYTKIRLGGPRPADIYFQRHQWFIQHRKGLRRGFHAPVPVAAFLPARGALLRRRP